MLPAAIALQVPALAPSQREHPLTQAELQQTQFAQKPEAQSEVATHEAPRGRPPPLPGVHAEPEQAAPVTQSAAPVQLDGQPVSVPLQRYAPHAGEGVAPSAATLHWPTLPARLQRSQDPVQAVLQQTPSAQLPELHAALRLQGLPSTSLGWHVPPGDGQ